jgi:hypothetical protein
MNKDIERREWNETKREFRYGLMRIARSTGHIIFWLGIVIICVGLMYFLMGLPEALGELLDGPDPTAQLMKGFHGHAYLQTFFGAAVCSVGIWFLALGPAIYGPYVMQSMMPSTYIRVCHKCGEAQPKAWGYTQCPVCKTRLPLGVAGHATRLVSSLATVINVTILLTAALIFLR